MTYCSQLNKLHFNQARLSALQHRQVSTPRLCGSCRAVSLLTLVSSTVRSSRRGLQQQNCQRQGLTSYISLPHLPLAAPVSGNTLGILTPCVCCTGVRWQESSQVASQEQGHKWYPAYHVSSRSYGAGDGSFIQLDNPSILKESMNGQTELLKCGIKNRWQQG